MFVVGVSYISLLQSVASRCSLPYVSTVREIAEGTTVLYVIEIELPATNLFPRPKQMFFWAYAQPNAISGYEKAALQAVRYLQSIYGLVVADYSFEGAAVYRKFVEAILNATPVQLPSDFFIQGSRAPCSSPHNSSHSHGALLLLQDASASSNPV